MKWAAANVCCYGLSLLKVSWIVGVHCIFDALYDFQD